MRGLEKTHPQDYKLEDNGVLPSKHQGKVKLTWYSITNNLLIRGSPFVAQNLYIPQTPHFVKKVTIGYTLINKELNQNEGRCGSQEQAFQ